jgi:hypothetical protein
MNAFTLLTLGPAAIYTYTHMFLHRGQEPFPQAMNAKPIADFKEKGLIHASGERRSILSRVGLGTIVFVRAALFVLLVALYTSAFVILAFSPFGLIWLVYLLVVGCLFTNI